MEWSLTGLPLPSTLRPSWPLTDDELIAFSRKNKPFRIERNASGEIQIMTPVGYEGGRIEIFVARELDYWAEEDGRGEASGPNTGFNLPDGSMLSPDAAWVSKARLKDFTPEQRKTFLPICPDFVVEILSASDSIKVLQAKMEVWLANGAQLAWLIDPYGANVTVYRPGREPETLHNSSCIEAEAPVAGFRLATSRLWV